jgi:hypothetical protein
MHWTGWLVVLFMVTSAGWMAFDGARALVKGDYVTPRSGKHAGRLGPWSRVVEAAGIGPRSTLMKTLFVVYGTAALVVTLIFALGIPRGREALILTAALGLWYLPFGTLLHAIAIVLLLLPPLRGG